MTAGTMRTTEVAADASTTQAQASQNESQRTPAGRAKDDWHRFVVDVWITPFNSVEFGIYKRSRNRAKSRQFTADMDIFAEIIENGERTGLLGYREDLWKQVPEANRRLVFRLFNETVNWRATMDLMVGRSLQQTIGARGFPVVAYSINTQEDNFMIYLERSAYKWPLLPENFSFFVMNGSQPEFYRLKRALIDLGGDYTLYDQRGQVVGKLDGAVFSIGGKWRGKVKSGHADKRLLTVLKLFAGMLIFNGEVRRHMKRLYRQTLSGKITPKLERHEADLYMNPRRIR